MNNYTQALGAATLRFLPVGLVCALVILLTGCRQEPSDAVHGYVVRIAYLPITHSAAVMALPHVADGTYDIQLVRFSAWPEVVEALRARRVDGASMLMEVAIRAFEMDDSLVTVSLSHRDGNVIVVDNSIESFQDLIGQTVAIPHMLSPHYSLLRMAFEREGMSVDDVNLVEISPAEMPFTMAARAISAYVVAEPWGSLAEARGIGRILERSNEILPDSVCCLLVFNNNLLEEHDGLLDWLLKNFEVAAGHAQDASEEVFAAFRNSTRFEREIIEQSLANTNFHDLTFTEYDFNRAAEYILRFGVLEDMPNFNAFIAGNCCHE